MPYALPATLYIKALLACTNESRLRKQPWRYLYYFLFTFALHKGSALSRSLSVAMDDIRFRVDFADDFVSSIDAPFVVVCGWFGARDKHVRKYTDELKKLRCGTMRTIMPDNLVFSPFSAGRDAYARDLLKAVRSARRGREMSGPLFFMFMSNGGCWLHAAMASARMLSPDGEFADLDEAVSDGGGLIFDSSPAFMTITSGAKVLTLGMSLVLRVVVTALFYVAAACMALGSILSTGGLDAAPTRVFWKSVREAPARRELYLYSDVRGEGDAHSIGFTHSTE